MSVADAWPHVGTGTLPSPRMGLVRLASLKRGTFRLGSQAMSSGRIARALAFVHTELAAPVPWNHGPHLWAHWEQGSRQSLPDTQPSKRTCQDQVSEFPDQSTSTSLPLIHTRVHTHTNAEGTKQTFSSLSPPAHPAGLPGQRTSALWGGVPWLRRLGRDAGLCGPARRPAP